MEPQNLLQNSLQLEQRTASLNWRALLIILTIAALLLGAIALVALPRGTPIQNVASANASDAFKEITLIGTSAYVLDLTNNAVLFEKNSDIQLPLASLAKVPLALVVAEALPQDSQYSTPHLLGTLGAEIPQGSRLRVRDILDFTLVSSSNHAAEFLARTADESVGTENWTLSRMNSLASDLGLQQTYFLNVSGLDISTTLSGAYGSARDTALLFAHAAKANAALFSETARRELSITTASGYSLDAPNTNLAEGEIPGLIMGKTGFTDLAGGNLVVVFDVGIAHPVVVVVLGSTVDGRFEDARKLVDAARDSIASQQ